MFNPWDFPYCHYVLDENIVLDTLGWTGTFFFLGRIFSHFGILPHKDMVMPMFVGLLVPLKRSLHNLFGLCFLPC